MSSRALRHILVGTVSVAIVFLGVLLSPILLGFIDGLTSRDWSRLSDIGQAYGAASAILSGLALIGVALSTWVQAREGRAMRVQMIRSHQFELNRYLMDTADFQAPGWTWLPAEQEARRRTLFTVATFQYFKTGYVADVFSEVSVRSELAREVFSTEFGRAYWEMARPKWVADAASGSRRDKEFIRVIEEEYKAALSSTTIEASKSLREERESPSPSHMYSLPKLSSLVAFSLGLGWVVGARIGRRASR
jgi:hypothetical protein